MKAAFKSGLIEPGQALFWGGLVVAALLFISLESSRRLGAEDDYLRALGKARAQKEHFLHFDAATPLPHPEAFDGPAYFAADYRYRLETRLLPLRDTGLAWLSTTKGTRQALRPAGWVQVPRPGGGVAALVCYALPGQPGRLLLPFTDATTGEQTGTQGRYVDALPLPKGRVLVDFNQAYHPYCLYNPALACVLPPAANILPFALRVGERLADD